MPRESKTDYALLGLLSLMPMSGYDMKAFISTSIGFFWHESYGQIYPALRRLHENGLVEREVEAQNGKPDRHLYTVTEAGLHMKLPFVQNLFTNLIGVFLGALLGFGAALAVERKVSRLRFFD